MCGSHTTKRPRPPIRSLRDSGCGLTSLGFSSLLLLLFSLRLRSEDKHGRGIAPPPSDRDQLALPMRRPKLALPLLSLASFCHRLSRAHTHIGSPLPVLPLPMRCDIISLPVSLPIGRVSLFLLLLNPDTYLFLRSQS